jgi:hypothetical protein
MTSDSRRARRKIALCVASALSTFALLQSENARAYWEEVDLAACHLIGGNWTNLVCPVQDNTIYRFKTATRVRAYARNNIANGVVVKACVTAADDFGTHCSAPKSSSTIGWVKLDPSLSEWQSMTGGFPYLKVNIASGWYSGFSVLW